MSGRRAASARTCNRHLIAGNVARGHRRLPCPLCAISNGETVYLSSNLIETAVSEQWHEARQYRARSPGAVRVGNIPSGR